MKKRLHFEIITPNQVVYKDDIDSLTLPTVDGEITILPGHISLIAPTKPGEITIRKDDKIKHLAVMRGFVETSENTVRLMADAAELAEEIDERRAEEARQRAEKAKEEAENEIDFAEAATALERALARVRVAGRKHQHHPKTM